MRMGLKDRVALVTGGSRGIGAAVCRELASYGCDIALTHLGDEERAAQMQTELIAAGRRVVVFASDAADSAQASAAVRGTVEKLGRLDFLVCNAGITRDGVVWKMSDEAWSRVLGVNLTGYFNHIREAGLIFKDQRSGRIVNITSINGLRGKYGQANYTAAKGGVIALTKTVARELGKFNVTVNAVAPGMVATEMAANLAPEFREAAIRETLLGRLAMPGDIAALVAFLCSDGARHITGEVIKVDGGQYL